MSHKPLLSSPIRPCDKVDKEKFISRGLGEDNKLGVGRSQTATFTLTPKDLMRIEEQIDRSILFSKRSKNKSAIIRMALKALEECSDEQYLDLYNRLK